MTNFEQKIAKEFIEFITTVEGATIETFILSALAQQREEIASMLKNYKCGEHKKLLSELNKGE